MTTMAENVIAAGADNRKEHGKDLLDSILHGTFQYGTVVEDGITRARTYEEVTDKEKIHEECCIRATNIVLQGLLPDVYNLVNHHTIVKEICDRVKLLIEGTELSLQERECKLYNEFDKFTSEKGEKFTRITCGMLSSSMI
ncbi:hypothetical protein Tco_0004756 [Tanacetum coccineum]